MGGVTDKDKGWKTMRDGIGKIGPVAVKVGVLEAAGLHDNAGDGGPMTVAQVAAVNEYGSTDGRIPERPAWRNALDTNKEAIGKALDRAADNILRGLAATGVAPVTVELNKVGLQGQAIIRRGIDGLSSPPNSPRTIAQKGSSKPLIDTAQTRNSVTYEILTGTAVDEAKSAPKGSG